MRGEPLEQGPRGGRLAKDGGVAVQVPRAGVREGQGVPTEDEEDKVGAVSGWTISSPFRANRARTLFF